MIYLHSRPMFGENTIVLLAPVVQAARGGVVFQVTNIVGRLAQERAL